MNIEATDIPDVVIITPRRFVDNRGFFSETWNLRALQKADIETDFVQDNQSVSVEAGTIRGLHYQAPPHAQTKLVRCGRGRLLDVVVDARVGSPTYGCWVAVELSAENGRQLLVPKGFLHGFVTLEPYTEILYKCSDYYAPECDGTVRWNDPDLGIEWGIAPSSAILSEKDAQAPAWRDFDNPFSWQVR